MVATIRKALDIILLYQGLDRLLQLFPFNRGRIYPEWLVS
jgi:hypothetical protein